MMEFSSADEMMAHYKAVRKRTRYWSPVAKPKPIANVPEAPPVQEIPTPYKYEPRWHFLVPPYDLAESPPEARHALISDCVRVVAQFYFLTEADLLSRRQNRQCSRPRQVAMYLAKTVTLKSWTEIGRRIGDRDHSTAIHAVRQITKRMESDPALAADVADLTRMLQE